jgi:RNA polymerase sigma factor (sigma-70 family)
VSLDRDTAVRLLIYGRTRLVGYIYSMVNDWSLCDDVFQEVSVLVLEKCGAIPDAERFGSWVRSAARLKAIKALWKRGRQPQLLGDAVLDLLDSSWDEDEAEEPGSQVETLRLCVRELTPRARRILYLRYVDGIKGEALARLLEQPPNTVYVALSRIHRQLARCIARRMAEDGARDGSSSQWPKDSCNRIQDLP